MYPHVPLRHSYWLEHEHPDEQNPPNEPELAGQLIKKIWVIFYSFL